jgi:lipoprotein NlpI
MREIYEMFAGRSTPDDVLAAAEAGDVSASERNSRRFYAHLYVGLYLEAAGDATRSLDQVLLAAEKYPIGHYMADVARTHVRLRDKVSKTAK